MPWSTADVSKHNKLIGDADKPKWVDIANGTRDSCIKRGGQGTMCDALAIATANAAFKESKETIMDDELLEMIASLEEATWDSAYMSDLPDSAFLYIAPGGEKDDEGKTQPRSLRYFPVYDSSGKLDLPHLRNALARIPQSNIDASAKDKALAKAKTLAEKHLASYKESEDMEELVPLIESMEIEEVEPLVPSSV